MSPPPHQIDGATVLLWTTDLHRTQPTSATTHLREGKILAPVNALAICQYDDDAPDVYLFYCSADWETHTDTWHATLEYAMRQAEYEYHGVTPLWQRTR